MPQVEIPPQTPEDNLIDVVLTSMGIRVDSNDTLYLNDALILVDMALSRLRDMQREFPVEKPDTLNP